MASSFYAMNPIELNSDFSSNSIDKSNDTNETDTDLPIILPKESYIKFDNWWNKSFAYRALINVTNVNSNHPADLINTWTYIQFNYKTLVDAGKMNSSLKDVRIVENGVVREYYISKDFPSTNIATVYFRTNCSKETTETDTYIYYGNKTVNYSSKKVNYNPYGINWYRFEEGSGETAYNELGKYNAKLSSAMEEGSDWKSTELDDPYQLGECFLNFDGKSSDQEYLYIESQFMRGRNLIPNMAVSCWFRTASTDTGDTSNNAFFSFDRDHYFEFYIRGTYYSNRIGFRTTAQDHYSNQISYSNAINLNNDEWHFAMCIFNKTHKIIYVDNATIADKIDTSPHRSGSYPSYTYYALGHSETRYGFMGDGSNTAYQNGGRTYEYYQGDLDEVRYFNWSLDKYEREQVYYQYELTAAMNEEHENRANIKVKVIGKDAEYIPGATITLNQTSGGSYSTRQISDTNGETIFTSLALTPIQYNFTVTINSSIHKNLQKIINITSPILFSDFYREITLICNVSTVEFDVKDVDGSPVESCWIIVGNETGEFTELQNCTVDSSGIAKFWWLDNVIYPNYKYNYSVYYQNPLYYTENPQLNKMILGKGVITNLRTDTTIQIKTNLTTVNFHVKQGEDPYNLVEGVKLQLYENISLTDASLVAELITNDEGNATLRWLNSSTQFGYPGSHNYTLKIDFWGEKPFSIPIIKMGQYESLSFEVSNAINYTVLLLEVNPDAYKMELISLNPTSNPSVKWGTTVTIRYLLNNTIYEEKPTNKTTPIDADMMTYTVKFGSITLSGGLNVEIFGSGRHIGVIDTSKLTLIGSSTSYSVTIYAQKAGYQSVQNNELTLTINKNNAIVNETYNDDTVKSNYWLNDINMTIQPYGENSESFVINYEIYKAQYNYQRFDFEFMIPEVTTEWNLSTVIFSLYEISFTQLGSEKINITDPYGISHIFSNTHLGLKNYGIGFSNGSWVDLNVPLNKKSITNDNIFKFKINGTFSDGFNLVAQVYFLRNSINTKYSLFNISDSIPIAYDGNGWVITNITFDLFNCRDPSAGWTFVDPVGIITKLTTNEGINYTFSSHNNGVGKIIVDNITVYPLDNTFLFEIVKSSSIMFDVNITIKYGQIFYWNYRLENVSTSISQQDFVNGGEFTISFENNFNNLERELIITDITDSEGNPLSPEDIRMNITIGGNTYNITESGLFSLVDFPLNSLLNAYIITNTLVNFSLDFSNINYRSVYYKIMGTVDYVVTALVKGTVPYNSIRDTYLLVLDTSSLNAQSYIVQFSFTSDYYNYAIKNLDIKVLERVTLLNGKTDLLSYFSGSIYIKEAINFTFSYNDRDYNSSIINLRTQTYDWNRYTLEGNFIESGSGTLIQNEKNEYVLDFDTELKSIGSYTFTVQLNKENYEVKIATVTLTINLRTFEYDLGDEFEDEVASVVKGKKITLTIELTDPTKGDAPLTGAEVILEIGDDELEFDEVEPGVYELEFDTEKYEAFFASDTLTGTIKISKEDYISDEVDITIIVQMEEIIPGIPAFYFFLVVAAILAVTGSLVAYKWIQIARIPKFVKKVRAMKKSIKIKKEISESLLTDTKEEIILKKFEENWNRIGLSLKDILGVKEKGAISSEGKSSLPKMKGGGD